MQVAERFGQNQKEGVGRIRNYFNETDAEKAKNLATFHGNVEVIKSKR
jgi:hypothetical protein